MTSRLRSLDAVRAFALLLGIVLHATMSFQSGLAAMGWPIVDNDPSPALDLVFYVIHVFRMATFFLIAGFFARLVHERLGSREFVRDRLRRIGLPLLIFWPLCIVPITATLVWGAYKLNGGELPPAPESAPGQGGFPLTHLWFLYLLLWLYAIGLCLGLAGVAADFAPVAHGPRKFVYAAAYAVALMAVTLACIAAGMRLFQRESPLIRYLADASYWVYIVHLPIVMALQVTLMDQELHWSLKFVLINGITFALAVASYQFLVRGRALGRLLRGRRRSEPADHQQNDVSAPLIGGRGSGNSGTNFLNQ